MMARIMQLANPAGLTDALLAMDEGSSESTLRQAALAGIRIIHAEAVEHAPVGEKAHERSGTVYPPGTLKRSIIIAFDKEDSIPGVRATYLVTWLKEAFYGRFAELGTAHQPASPFLRPAYDAKRDEAAQETMGVVQERVAAKQRK